MKIFRSVQNCNTKDIRNRAEHCYNRPVNWKSSVDWRYTRDTECVPTATISGS